MDKTTQAPSGLGKERILGIRRGIEKESLRTHSNAALAISPHPAALGSALTHPHITTDFSESQIELITGVHAGFRRTAPSSKIHIAIDGLRHVVGL